MINDVPQIRNVSIPDILMRGSTLPDTLNWTPALFSLAYILEVPSAYRHWVSTVVRRSKYQCLKMIILGVTWDVEKCLYARDPLAGLGVGTLERGQNMGSE